MSKNIVTGLDLGTTKVCAVIAERISEEEIKILGYGVAPSEGLHKGLVANIGKTAEAIKEAMSIASNRAGVEVEIVNVGVAGEHITSMRLRNYVTITNDEHEITQSDLDRLKEDLKTIPIPADRQILHIIPEEFFVDHQGGIEDPIGMSGSRLEAASHIVLASTPAIQNIKKSVERAGYEIDELILQPIASSMSVLDPNEKDIGVLLIDIGGGTTDVAVIHRKAIKHSKVFGIAGNQVTNDIRESIGVVTAEAEQLKKRYGYALEKAIIKDESILIKGVGARENTEIPVSLLTQIISLRMRELFTLIENDIKSAGLMNKLKAGIVLTGGGSLLRGCTELVKDVFGIPAKIGIPLERSGGTMLEVEKPEYATAIGLLNSMSGSKPVIEEEEVVVKKVKKKTAPSSNKVKQLWNSFRTFFDEL